MAHNELVDDGEQKKKEEEESEQEFEAYSSHQVLMEFFATIFINGTWIHLVSTGDWLAGKNCEVWYMASKPLDSEQWDGE